jgi:hypothetical protein
MALPVSFYSSTYNDHTAKSNGKPETTNWEVAVTEVTDLTIVAVGTAVAALQTATDAITLGIKGTTALIAERIKGPITLASSPLAQRENKWLVRYHGATLLNNYQVSIGTCDLSLVSGHSEFLDITVNPGLAFKNAFEAVVVSPGDGAEAVVVDSVQFVGRNT